MLLSKIALASFLISLNLLFLSSHLRDEKKIETPGLWVPDQGSTYKNPIIYADYSDPDVIRIGDDFYLTSSSFVNTPGLPVLHSKDLVNWTIIGHAIDNLPDKRYDKPLHGDGVWAPSIRFHNGEFYIYYGDPDIGIFVVKTKNPAGRWNKPVLIKKAKGWEDPCPLWDDDGKAYLIHAWVKSRAGLNSILSINRMNDSGTKIIDEGKTVFDGHKTQPTIEGPKLYKRNGYYYIFAPAGGVTEGWQTVLRSKNIYGPYEERIVLEQGKTNINGPHQGAWVETKTGQSWFLHFQDKGAFGRIVFLEPMKWKNNLPLIGIYNDKNGIGEPVYAFKKPGVVKNYASKVPQTTDEFNSTKLGLQWQWEANHKSNWYSLTKEHGYLVLNQIALPDDYINLWQVPNLLMQKFPAPEFTVTTKLIFDPRSSNDESGLIIFGRDYSYLSISKNENHFILQKITCKNAFENGKDVLEDSVSIPNNIVYLRVHVDSNAVCSFGFSTDGKKFMNIGKIFVAKKGQWVGAKVGLFALTSKKYNPTGYTKFDWFRFK